MNPLRQLVKLTMTSLLPSGQWLVKARRTDPVFAWTFDDGPDPLYTPPVLDALHQVGAKGTFFVIGEKAAQHPDLIRRIIAEGHEIGNHTWSHGEPGLVSADQLAHEIDRTQDLIERLTRTTPRWFRPPKGQLTLGKLKKVMERKLSTALWSLDPKDWKMESAEELVTWCSGRRPTPGDVVLLHDNHRFAAIAVRLWAREAWHRDWSGVTLSELVQPSDSGKSETQSGEPTLDPGATTESEGLPCPTIGE